MRCWPKKAKVWKPIFAHCRAKGLFDIPALVILAPRIAHTAWSMCTPKAEFDANDLPDSDFLPWVIEQAVSSLRDAYSLMHFHSGRHSHTALLD
jgi:hypothetical protein